MFSGHRQSKRVAQKSDHAVRKKGGHDGPPDCDRLLKVRLTVATAAAMSAASAPSVSATTSAMIATTAAAGVVRC